jgi:hypothetical protein
MARRTREVTITDEGRDQGKVFFLTEMPAMQADRWSMRALMAIAHTGITIPEEVFSMGMAGIMALGIHSLVRLSASELLPLLDEIHDSCVAHIPDPAKPMVKLGKPGGAGPLPDNTIEEVKTYMTLRKELLSLHTGFSPPDVR